LLQLKYGDLAQLQSRQNRRCVKKAANKKLFRVTGEWAWAVALVIV
jgi:hypothetical protein